MLHARIATTAAAASGERSLSEVAHQKERTARRTMTVGNHVKMTQVRDAVETMVSGRQIAAVLYVN